MCFPALPIETYNRQQGGITIVSIDLYPAKLNRKLSYACPAFRSARSVLKSRRGIGRIANRWRRPDWPQCISAEAGKGRWRWTEAVSRKTTNRAPRSAPCGRLLPHAGKPDTGGQYAGCLLHLLQRLPGIAGLSLEVGEGPDRRFGIGAQADGKFKFFRHRAECVLSFGACGRFFNCCFILRSFSLGSLFCCQHSGLLFSIGFSGRRTNRLHPAPPPFLIGPCRAHRERRLIQPALLHFPERFQIIPRHGPGQGQRVCQFKTSGE